MRVHFSDSEPSEGEYLEEFNNYNMKNEWFILIYIMRSIISFSSALQINLFELPGTIDSFMNYTSKTSSFFYNAHCYAMDETGHPNTSQPINQNVSRCMQENLIMELNICKYVGIILGAILSGTLADIYGRRVVTLSSSFLWMFSVFFAFLRSLVAFEVVFVASTMFTTAVNTVAFVNFAEICNKKNRILSVYIPSQVLGVLLVHFISIVMKKWTYLMILNILFITLVIYSCWYTPESPRWLLNKNRRREAYLELMEISGLVYRFPLPDQRRRRIHHVDTYMQMFKYLFVQKKKASVLLLLIMTVTSLCYTCGKWNMMYNFSTNRKYTLIFILTEMGSYLFILPIYFFIGKRYGIFLTFLFLLIGSLVVMVTYENVTMMYFSIFGVLLGRTSLQFSLLYIMDIFPTYVRSTSIGIYRLWYGIISIVSILLKDNITFTSDLYYYLIFGIAALFGLPVLFLPSTSKLDLPNNKIYSSAD